MTKVLKEGDEIKLEEYDMRNWTEYNSLMNVANILHRDYMGYLERAQRSRAKFWETIQRRIKVAKGHYIEIDTINLIINIKKTKKEQILGKTEFERLKQSIFDLGENIRDFKRINAVD